MDLRAIARTQPVAGATRFFAHGKVILLGEHAVVYGCPALAGALGVGVSVDSRPAQHGGVLSIPAFALRFSPTGDSDQSLGRAYLALRAELALPPSSPVDLEATFEVPAGAGLGSSAALGVAVARALLAAHGRIDEARVLDAALAWETVIHGRPSGLDHTVAAQSGFGVFVRGQGLTPVRAARPVPLLVGHTGRARDTKGRVSRVAELLAADPSTTQGRFAHIAELVAEARRAVEAGDLATLGRTMRQNQEQLDALEVSCGEIAEMCRLAYEAGALGAKLTGGGGGGCVLALAPDPEQAEAVQAAWLRAGFTSFATTVGDSSMPLSTNATSSTAEVRA